MDPTQSGTQPNLSKGQLKRQDKRQKAHEFNLMRHVYKTDRPRSTWKWITDDMFFEAKFQEAEDACIAVAARAKEIIQKLPEALQKFADKEVLKSQTSIRNRYKKKYGRSKYIPH